MTSLADHLTRVVEPAPRVEPPPAMKTGIPDRVSIFVTVGTELPFDRLVNAVDRWAAASHMEHRVFAQTGHTDRPPAHIRSAPMLHGADFSRLFSTADVVVAHAGMGTILAALVAVRPLLVVPRRCDLGEHRSDHQVATVERLSQRGLVTSAKDEHELVSWLQSSAWRDTAPASMGPFAQSQLLDTVRAGIVA